MTYIDNTVIVDGEALEVGTELTDFDAVQFHKGNNYCIQEPDMTKSTLSKYQFALDEWETVKNTPVEENEDTTVNSITMRQVRKYLLSINLLSDVETLMISDIEMQVEWDTAYIVERSNPIIAVAMADLGLTDAQAAGIVGNFAHETMDFKFLQEIEPTVPGSKGGRGFAMWTGPRRKQFEAWSKENNLDPDSYEASFGFFIHEVQTTSEGRFIEEIQEAETAEEAARIFSKSYLRPGKPMMSSRVDRANCYIGAQ